MKIFRLRFGDQLVFRLAGAKCNVHFTSRIVRASALAQFLPSVYVQDMTQAVAQILGEFEQLSEKERQQLRRAIVERVPMSDDLTDDDFAALAAASFRALDEEENTPRA